jgi:hypothetical protein
MLVFLLGSGTLALYQVAAMEDQLEQVTQAVDKMDGQVKRAQYEKTKFYRIARDVLRLSPKDPTAEQIVVRYKLRQLQNEQPELMASGSPSDLSGLTNAPPVQPGAATNASPATNAAPATSPSPTAK